MWKDPIVEETRNLRDEYARQLNYDIDAIFEDITRRQIESGKKLVSFPPRKPSKMPNKDAPADQLTLAAEPGR